MTLTEVVRMLTDIQLLVEVPRRLTSQQDAKVSSWQLLACSEGCRHSTICLCRTGTVL